jgi:hypothetical protein
MPFDGRVLPVPEPLRRRMRRVSWHDDPRCPQFSDLALIDMPHRTFQGGVGRGRLIVAAALADEVLAVFAALFAAGFPIDRMEPVCEHGGDDDASMAANNCSGFNFRRIMGTDTLSQHALGRAIDINPVQNPMLKDGGVQPPAGRAYLDRTDVRPGMIVRPGPVTDAFDAVGWTWGGDWTAFKDYHHFVKT